MYPFNNLLVLLYFAVKIVVNLEFLLLFYIQVGKRPLPDDEEEELQKIISEMKNVYGATTVCFNGTEWSKLPNRTLTYNILEKEEKERNHLNVPFREGKGVDFQEPFPSWKVKVSHYVDAPFRKTKFLLKKLPSGVTSYSKDIPFRVSSYSALPAMNTDECVPLSPDLNEIMATSSDYQLRTYVWKVTY